MKKSGITMHLKGVKVHRFVPGIFVENWSWGADYMDFPSIRVQKLREPTHQPKRNI